MWRDIYHCLADDESGCGIGSKPQVYQLITAISSTGCLFFVILFSDYILINIYLSRKNQEDIPSFTDMTPHRWESVWTRGIARDGQWKTRHVSTILTAPHCSDRRSVSSFAITLLVSFWGVFRLYTEINLSFVITLMVSCSGVFRLLTKINLSFVITLLVSCSGLSDFLLR